MMLMINDDYDYINSLKNDPTIKTIEIFTIIISVISMMFSGSVVFILLYKYKKLVMGKTLIHILLIISICDTILSFSYALGYPSLGNICKLQGFLAETFEKGSWLFTNILILNIYGILKWNVILIKIKIMHLVIWPIILLLSFLPYSMDVGYGTELEFSTISRCAFVSMKSTIGFPSNYEEIWNKTNQSIALFTILFITLLTFLIYCDSIQNENGNGIVDTRIESGVKTMVLYPLSLLICWVPSQCFDLILEFKENIISFSSSIKVSDGLYMIAPLHGLFVSLIFYSKTKQAKSEWLKILKDFNIIKESNSNEIKETSLNAIRITES